MPGRLYPFGMVVTVASPRGASTLSGTSRDGGTFFQTGSNEPFRLGRASDYGGSTARMDMVSVETLDMMRDNNFFEYIPFRGRMSPFWKDKWLSYDITRHRETYAGNQIPEKTDKEVELHEDVELEGADILRYF